MGYFLSRVLCTKYFEQFQSTISNRIIENDGIFSRISKLLITKKISPIMIIAFAKSSCPASQTVSFLRVHLVFIPKIRLPNFEGNANVHIPTIIRNRPIRLLQFCWKYVIEGMYSFKVSFNYRTHRNTSWTFHLLLSNATDIRRRTKMKIPGIICCRLYKKQFCSTNFRL